jgi:hypothetical protein
MITDKNLNEAAALLAVIQKNEESWYGEFIVLKLVGLPPKLGKNKTRKKIQEANRKYQRKIAKAKQSVEKLRLAKQLLNPLRRRLNLDDLIKRDFMVEQLPDSISLCNGFVGYPGKL